MLYASEAIQLMAAHPGRPFKMAEIRRYVETSMSVRKEDKQRRTAIRKGLLRVMHALIECGAVVYESKQQRVGRYVWR